MNAIEINSMTKSYKDFTLSDITMALPEGMIMGLVGENGAGKTTLIKALLGIHPIDSGSFTVLGCGDPRHNKQIMNDIGVVLDGTGLPAQLTVKEVSRVLSDIYSHWDQAYFDSLCTTLELSQDKKCHELSRGNVMKAQIICALSHHPKLLILDEATSGLDPVVRDEILDLFLEFTRDEHHSILLSSHIVSDLEKACDLITFLHKGKLLLSEEKDTLKDQYRMVHCPKDALAKIDSSAVIGIRENAYGAEAVIKKDAVPADMESFPADLEELFVLMVKGELRK
ncbi:MAG: ABC transporter ATP-binding protein [Solobacterium sp.]|nr:ABC transporter ATP-binding protein [Solobacterium sp.]